MSLQMKLVIVRKSKCDPEKEDECSAGNLQQKVTDVVAAVVKNITEREGVEVCYSKFPVLRNSTDKKQGSSRPAELLRKKGLGCEHGVS